MEDADFSRLIRRCAGPAYNFAFRLTGNEPDARDLVQEAFARALEHRSSYDTSLPFEPWLLRILRNIYLDGMRRYERRHAVPLDAASEDREGSLQDVLAGVETPAMDVLIQRETDAMVQDALGTLPMDYRTAVLLRDVEGLSYEKIGEVMDCPVGTVRSRIHQGRVLLRRAFERLERSRRGGLA